jgi:hypothetical protein|tara:strand:- start:1095 stop:1280 length:186 start_codon:yes stop_codon:yes gene_type:complete
MAKGVAHYFRDGKEYKGKMHKMSDGTLHSGASHTKSSKKLFHLKELSKTAQKRAKSGSKKV